MTSSNQKKGSSFSSFNGFLVIVALIILVFTFTGDLTKIVDTFVLLVVEMTGLTIYSFLIWTAMITTIVMFMYGLKQTGIWPSPSMVLAVYSLPSYLCTLSYASIMGDQEMMHEVNVILGIAITLSVVLWILGTFKVKTVETTDYDEDGNPIRRKREKQYGGD